MECRFSELRCKEVVNTADGCRLGFICDLVIDLRDGRIIAIVVPGPCKVLGMFGRTEDFVIPWQCIKRIGGDIILVDIATDKIRAPRPKKAAFLWQKDEKNT